MKKYWKKKIDERQEADLRRVESYGYWIAFWLLLASVLMKSVILSRPLTEWFTEWLIFMILAVYGVVAFAKIGVWTEFSVKPTLISSAGSSLLGSLAFSALFTAGSWLQSGKTMEWDRMLMLFISWLIGLFAVLFATFLVLMWVYRARDRRMQKKMDEELEEDDDEEL